MNGAPKSPEPGNPWITAVISTRDRAAAIAHCVESVLRCQDFGIELRVVDQSADSATEEILGPFFRDPRFHYLRSDTRGLSAGRNLGIAQARGELIACTDDDCETRPDWLNRIADALRRDERTAAVFGRVHAAPHDREKGFIPCYGRSRPFLARNLQQYHLADGMSGCMGLRRSAWEQIGGFDEQLGAGAPFRAAEDMDFAIRALLAGFPVYSTPEVEVIHHGFRYWRDADRLIQGYLFGIGAMIAKHLKCGNWSILHYVTHLAWRWAFGAPVIDLGRKPPRCLRLRAACMGAAAGFAHAVERRHSLFRAGPPRTGASPK